MAFAGDSQSRPGPIATGSALHVGAGRQPRQAGGPSGGGERMVPPGEGRGRRAEADPSRERRIEHGPDRTGQGEASGFVNYSVGVPVR